MGKISRKENHKRKLASQLEVRAKNSPRKISQRARKAAFLKTKTERLAAKGIDFRFN